jgi:hypothetical protein
MPDPLASNINGSLPKDALLLTFNLMGLFCTNLIILTHENTER